MLKRSLKFSLRWLPILGIVSLLGLILPTVFARSFAQAYLSTLENVPSSPVAIVFGAGLSRNGSPSPILRDRVETAVELYKNGTVEKLLMSGDNRFVDYNEPAAMLQYAVSLGVPEEDIVQDFAGRRTYDTCYRARYIFGVEEAILVTQDFHLTRALFTCNNLGVQSSGVPADVRHYGRRSYLYWYLREMPATSVAMWEVWVSHPLPVLGAPEPIFKSDAETSARRSSRGSIALFPDDPA